jgi:hypothetical protein
MSANDPTRTRRPTVVGLSLCDGSKSRGGLYVGAAKMLR